MSRLACLLVFASLGASACTTAGEDDRADPFGQVDLALTGTASSGTIYRLRNGELTIAGPGGPIVFRTEDDLNRTVISQDLDVGDYSLTLSPGFSLDKLGNDGVFRTVVATLISPNPQAFTITTSTVTPVVLRFQTAGEVVVMDRGRVDIRLGVDEVFSIGGQVTGLACPGLVLKNNGADDLAINGDGPFTFPTLLANGQGYSVTVAAQPSGQICTVINDSGGVLNRNVTNVQVTCVDSDTAPFPIAIPNSNFSVGDLVLDNHGDLLVSVSPGSRIVKVNRVTGEQTVVASNVSDSTFLLALTYRAANDTIYAATTDQIFAVTPSGVVTPFSTVPQLNALTIAPAGFGTFEGFLIGVTVFGSVIAVDPTNGVVTTITGDRELASDLAFAPDGTLYIAGGSSVRTVTAGGVETTFTTGFSFADGIAITPDGGRMFIADSGSDTVIQVTIPGAVSSTFAFADIDDGFFVGGILAAPDGKLIVMTGEDSLTLVAFPL